MSVTRRDVLETLAAETDAVSHQTAGVSALEAELAAADREVLAHLRTLVACELAVREGADEFRISVTGEEFLALDPDGESIVDPRTRSDPDPPA